MIWTPNCKLVHGCRDWLSHLPPSWSFCLEYSAELFVTPLHAIIDLADLARTSLSAGAHTRADLLDLQVAMLGHI